MQGFHTKISWLLLAAVAVVTSYTPVCQACCAPMQPQAASMPGGTADGGDAPQMCLHRPSPGMGAVVPLICLASKTCNRDQRATLGSVVQARLLRADMDPLVSLYLHAPCVAIGRVGIAIIEDALPSHPLLGPPLRI